MKTQPLTLILHDWEARAILANQMTQLRRPVNPQPPEDERLFVDEYRETLVDDDGELRPGRILFGVSSEDGEYAVPSPFGKPGDEIVGNEAWGKGCDTKGRGCVYYKADESAKYVLAEENGEGDWVEITTSVPKSNLWFPVRWIPANRMPRWASRIRIVNRSLRVERLGEMTEADAVKSGCGSPITRDCKLPNFIARWMEDERRGKWEPGRLVWVLDFERKKPA